MTSDPFGNDVPLPSRRPVRLKGYDYSQSGAYFVTVCTKDRACLFGEVTDGEMRLNERGQIVEACWLDIPPHFPHAELDTFVVMPNHVHGVIRIVRARHAVPLREATTQPEAGASTEATTTPESESPGEGFGKPTAGSVPTIVRSFKAAVTKRINEIGAGAGTACRAPTGQSGPIGRQIWQRGYYEHVIRDDKALSEVRQYIADNPAQWALDSENPLVGAGETGPELRDPMGTT